MLTLSAILEKATAAGYLTQLETWSHRPTTPLNNLYDVIRSGSLGLIAVSPDHDLLLKCETLSQSIPLIIAHTNTSSSAVSVRTDDEAGSRLATRHLIELGHTAITHISGPPNSPEAIARRRGWHTELRSSALPQDLLVGDWSPESGYAAGQQLSRRRTLPDAVFVANDLMALGLIRAMTLNGVHIPHQVSVVGYEDHPTSPHLTPSLTTVRPDVVKIGIRSFQALTSMINNQPVSDETVVPYLILRHSSARRARSSSRG